MGTPFRIAAATGADGNAVHSLVLALARHVGSESQVRLTAEQLRADMDAGRCWCLAARADPVGAVGAGGEEASIVGFALGYETYSTWEGRGLYLEDLYVIPDARGAGLGKQLRRAVADKALREGCARLQWQAHGDNAGSIKWYASETVGARERVEPSGARWVNLIMRTAEMESLVGLRSRD
ncbi:hypothetical protein KFE25_009729 [Diacronema lutheri]|uniref:N-acetyltransferase domain-containing protein n=1 Tax=Diacronema lutheri TaxID=2081491 RepID=A0A8J6CKN8_DIALT|nr:hypothetical protein KFE25_009729 [Diacronema lutheri]